MTPEPSPPLRNNFSLEPSTLDIEITDEEFNRIYPPKISKLAEKHFTPLAIAKAASEFLVTKPRARVLDIGSGAGKFCMVGATHTQGHFTGIEQRSGLVELSKNLSASYGIQNVTFLHMNVVSGDFHDFDSFYIYNSFYENIDKHDRMDDAILLTNQLYSSYLMYTKEQLSRAAPGARLATFHTMRTIVPSDFMLIDSLHEAHLELWQKNQ